MVSKQAICRGTYVHTFYFFLRVMYNFFVVLRSVWFHSEKYDAMVSKLTSSNVHVLLSRFLRLFIVSTEYFLFHSEG